MIDTIHPDAKVPADHRVTVIPGTLETYYWLYGWRETANGTARFTLIHGTPIAQTRVVANNVPWPTVYPLLTAIIGSAGERAAETLRSCLP